MSFIEKSLEPFTAVADSYIKGNNVWSKIRRILDPLFTIVISCSLYERLYSKFILIDITDYKSIIDFFIRGWFIKPLGLFLIVHIVILLVGLLLLLSAAKLVGKLRNRVKLTTEQNISMYNSFKKSYTEEKWKETIDRYSKEKISLQWDFLFVIKAILLTVYYNFISPDFRITLLITLLIGLVIIGLFILLMYFIMDFFLRIDSFGNLSAKEH